MTILARTLRCSLVAAALLHGSSAHAEPPRRPGPTGEPSKAALDEAKALYVAGNRAVEQGRWADALTSFERSYQLSGVPAALFNVATTLRALGRHVDARDAFAQLLAGPRELDPAVRKKAEGLLAEEQSRIAGLRLAGLPAASSLELRLTLDGNVWKDDGARPLSTDIDPGRHTLTIEATRTKPFTWEGVLADGEKKTVAVKLLPVEQASPPTTGPVPVPAPPPEKKSSVFASPIFWTVVGVVVVGGAVAGGYAWHQSRQLDPGPGPVVHL